MESSPGLHNFQCYCQLQTSVNCAAAPHRSAAQRRRATRRSAPGPEAPGPGARGPKSPKENFVSPVLGRGSSPNGSAAAWRSF